MKTLLNRKLKLDICDTKHDWDIITHAGSSTTIKSENYVNMEWAYNITYKESEYGYEMIYFSDKFHIELIFSASTNRHEINFIQHTIHEIKVEIEVHTQRIYKPFEIIALLTNLDFDKLFIVDKKETK